MTRTNDTDESFTNDFDATLGEIRNTSISIDELLSTTGSLHYESKVAADMATANKLLYWRFSEPATIEILETYRQDAESKTDYRQLVQKIAHTEVHPIDSDLGRAIIQSSKNLGGRPAAGVATLTEIQLSFELLGDCLTVTDIIESDVVTWGDAKRTSVRRRINRGLGILADAGYVSYTSNGRTNVYQNEGVTSLSFPEHSCSQSSSISYNANSAVSSVDS
jgi:hypothetical protein